MSATIIMCREIVDGETFLYPYKIALDYTDSYIEQLIEGWNEEGADERSYYAETNVEVYG